MKSLILEKIKYPNNHWITRADLKQHNPLQSLSNFNENSWIVWYFDTRRVCCRKTCLGTQSLMVWLGGMASVHWLIVSPMITSRPKQIYYIIYRYSCVCTWIIRWIIRHGRVCARSAKPTVRASAAVKTGACTWNAWKSLIRVAL